MIKPIAITLLVFLTTLTSYAQKNKEKIQALKVAHITQTVSLTKEEAQKFWPLYNTYESKKNALRKLDGDAKRSTDFKNLSEAESKAFIENMLKNEAAKTALRKKFITDLNNVISAKKIIKLIQAERSFKLKILEEYKTRLKNKKAGN